MRVSNHAKKRIVERGGANYIKIAKKNAHIAWAKGKRPGDFENDEKTYNYLLSLIRSNTTSLRVYGDLIYIYKGAHKTLVTVHHFPPSLKENKIESK